MTTYADPTRCPDCRAVLPVAPQACRVCALPLTGETAVALFATFQEADRLLVRLRSEKQAAPVPVGAGVPAAPAGGGSLLEDVPAYPAPRPPAGNDAPRLSGASVPRILLSLGALCLLVAAVTFLAVAWSWLGVGGRTLVLVAFTAASLGTTALLVRRGLRMAAEALSVVGLGLLALDVVGVRHAGWLGEIDDAHVTFLAGAVVAAAALVILLSTAPRPLVAPALIAPLAALLAGAGAQYHTHSPAPMVVTCLALLALARFGAHLPSIALTVTAFPSAAAAWLFVVASGLDRATDPLTLAHVWGHLAAWPLVVAVALAAIVGPVTRVHRAVGLAGLAIAGLLGSYVLVLPVLDNAPTAVVGSLALVALAWVAAVLVAPVRYAAVASVPLLGTLVVPVVSGLQQVGQALRAVLDVGDPFTAGAGVHVLSADTWAAAWLLAPTALLVAAAGAALAGLVTPVRRTTWVVTLAGTGALAVVATLPLYDVPLALVVGLLALVAAVALLAAERVAGTAAHLLRVGAAALLLAATAAALPSDVLTASVLRVATAAAALLMGRSDLTGDAAALALPPAFAGLVWAAANVASVDQQLRAVPVLLVLGGLAIWRPQVELEASSALAGTLISAAAIAAAPDEQLALAVHLTVAGVLVTATSIVHPSRRLLAWLGGLLLAAATWVRLEQVGVHVVEAYTLPSALVLVAVGLWRLRHDDEAATVRYLAPGLTLATVPSLLVALDDPASLRALLLGAGCLALLLAGAALRWSAPLVVGAVVGALLVLRELAPYAAQVPTWLTIGLSGAVLLAVGITWESRMGDLRRATHYLAALR
jgi:hypothetical protein